MRLFNIFKTTNVTNLTKVILESSYYRALQVRSKRKTPKQPTYFLEAVELWPTFDINLAIFWEKLQNHTF